MNNYHPPTPDDTAVLAAETYKLYRWSAEELIKVINSLREADLPDGKGAGTAIKELRAAFGWALDERNNVEKIAKSLAAAAGAKDGYDLDAARSEIGVRLARLRAARDDDRVSDEFKR